jgi:glyoxylase-like metal-dependent hydrolase (beta-lactamase superfamily II)
MVAPPAHAKEEPLVLTEIADGVFVRQSEFCQSNAVVLRGDGVVLVDPGVSGNDLEELADDVSALGIPIVAGVATHPHWDHLLWHERFGRDVPRYGTAACVATVRERLESMREMAARFAPGAPLDLVGAITPFPPGDGETRLGRDLVVIEHRAHAPGHAALVIEGVGVLLAGDMLSDVEIPLLDPRAPDPCGDYLAALDLLESAIANGISVVVPGHGAVARDREVTERVVADRDYVRALLRGDDAADSRVGPGGSYGREWMPEAHERNIELGRRQAPPGRSAPGRG